MTRHPNFRLIIIASLLLALISTLYVVKRNDSARKIVTPINKKLEEFPIVKQTNTLPYFPEPPSIEKIFSEDHSWTATLAAEKKLVLIATGDVIPARKTNHKTAVEYKDFLWPWKRVENVLKQADITLINLESPIFSGCVPTQASTFVFCGDSRHIEGLTYAGVDAASLANNHSGNFGVDGIRKTEDTLEKAGITHFGTKDNPAIREVKGIKIAFLGYNDIGVEIEKQKMAAEITQAKRDADLVVVEFHWGTEYVTPPDPRLVELGQLAVDSGADLIIGNHPHWIKPIEWYRGKLITYGHGNFIFDQEWSQKTKEGVVGRYVFYDKQLVDVEYLPLLIEDFGQPHFLEGGEKRRILKEMKEASLPLQKSSKDSTQ